MGRIDNRPGTFVTDFSRFWGSPMQPPIPTNFSPAMSYWEQLEFILRKIDEFQKNVIHDIQELRMIFYSHEDRVVEGVKWYIDERDAYFYGKLEAEIGNLSADLSAEVEKIKLDLTAMPDDILRKAAKMFQVVEDQVLENVIEIANLKMEIMDNFQILNDDILKLDQELVAFEKNITDKVNSDLQNAINELREMLSSLRGETITVINPVKNLPTDLNTALIDIWLNPRWGGITAEEYRSLKLTAGEYDGMDITALDYRDKARWIFFERLYVPSIYLTINELKKELVQVRLDISNLTNKVTTLEFQVQDLLNKEYIDPFSDGRRAPLQEILYTIAEKIREVSA